MIWPRSNRKIHRSRCVSPLPTYEAAGDRNNVARAASLAIAAGSRDVDSVVRRGWAHIYLARSAEAAADFRQAIERQPGSAVFRLGLFLATAEGGDLALANAQWKQVLDAVDEPATDRWNTVSAHLSRLTNSRPEGWWFWRARGHVSMRLGHPDQAENDYDKAIAARPNDGWSWLGRGLARKSRNQAEPAIADFAQCAKLEPNVPTSWAARGEILGTLGRWDEAARAFDRWCALGGEPLVIPWYFHAALRLYAGDQPGYRRACQTMIERFGTTSDPFHMSLVAHAATLGSDSGVDPGRVVKAAEQAARTNPRDIWLVYTVGAALRRAGRLDEAVTSLDQAARIKPDWSGTPLIAALRDLSRRARQLQSGRPPDSAPTIGTKNASDIDASTLENEIRKTHAAWQFQLEARLLGRELDASHAQKSPATKAHSNASTDESDS